MSKVPVGKIISGVVETISDEKVQKAIMGTYADGTPRSFVDCINDEYLSPKQREKYVYKGKKKKKKKKPKIDL